MEKLLLLDVDGPLNPFRQLTKKGYLPPKARGHEPRFAYDVHPLRPVGWESGAALRVLLSREMGEQLAALADVFTLVWATTWEEEANTILSPLLGLPDLPVIAWPAGAGPTPRPTPGHRGSWKTRHILRWLDEHAVTPDGTHLPWVWVDDEIRSADRVLVRDHYGERHGAPQTVRRWLLHIEPSHGLRRHDLAELRRWAGDVDAERGGADPRRDRPAPAR